MATRIQWDDADSGSTQVVGADVLRGFFTGTEVPCPVGCGGSSELVRTGTRADGGGEVWFECLSCAQRRRYDVPAATPGERRAVAEELAANRDPACPRHALREPLKRRGRQLVCGRCGVRFRE
jgi:hypothetical protein